MWVSPAEELSMGAASFYTDGEPCSHVSGNSNGIGTLEEKELEEYFSASETRWFDSWRVGLTS
jgi:hypothetical protein